MECPSLLKPYFLITDEVCNNRNIYRPNCDKSCPSNCTDWCRKQDGWCPECQDGYKGDDCNQACAAPCAACETLTGKCIRCHHKYGDMCNKQCGEGCGSACYSTGSCSSCKAGFYGYACELKCSFGCQGGTCRKDGSCRCKARHQLKQSFYCIPCPKNCLNSCSKTLSCNKCKFGYFGDRCQNPCSPHCNEECNRHNGTCQCKVGYAGNPCQECPVNCDENGCDDTFRCKGCKPGFYGNSCNKICPVGCKNDECNREGRCSPCKDGYASPRCKPCPENCFDGCDETVICRSCKEKFYGDFCNKSCPLNCLSSCSKDKGICQHCVAGYKGEKCQESKCKYYLLLYSSFNCVGRTSQHCLS